MGLGETPKWCRVSTTLARRPGGCLCPCRPRAARVCSSRGCWPHRVLWMVGFRTRRKRHRTPSCGGSGSNRWLIAEQGLREPALARLLEDPFEPNLNKSWLNHELNWPFLQKSQKKCPFAFELDTVTNASQGVRSVASGFH